MKIDLIYPKIPENSDKFLGKCVAFEKYDGTNLHWIWDDWWGWEAFGTRRTQFTFDEQGIKEFSKEHSELRLAPQIFKDTLKKQLDSFLRGSIKYRKFGIILYTEFYGPNSFAGNHSKIDEENNSQKLIIIDVAHSNGGFLSPQQFINDFSQFGIADVIYEGKYTGQFTEDVRKGKYNVNEGVVCKGMVDNEVFMTKIKTNEYLRRLKQR